ncbi:uncharacterized protein AC631_05684 [Debaryomyces fabryi]|uniref:Uncharacterized protein n=1 Tax=Debaryomyces fabryi TaxID=58627 RepID=A0A0V1PQN8_9ASCO|nr:uncharacterized protein AC631_05684 [Debaryomyces fabryi]KRZ98551.1 hypothetical protein AC631_05684 [Debaryomyces fabryi]CUM56306.1 unnamed protein product [Debaryomyces fabryi]
MRFLSITQLLILASTFLTISSSAISRDEFNDKTIQKRDFPKHDLAQTFQNVWNSGLPVRQMTLWGAFTYYGSKSTFGLIDQCNLCIANHQDPPGTNCQDSLEGLARNLAATVMAGIGIAYTNGWLGKREDFYLRAILMVLLTFLLVMISMLLIMRLLTITLMITIITIYWLIIMNQNIASNETRSISVQ